MLLWGPEQSFSPRTAGCLEMWGLRLLSLVWAAALNCSSVPPVLPFLIHVAFLASKLKAHFQLMALLLS